MSALYAFSRRVDDIGDGALAGEVKAARLEDTRALLARVREGSVGEDDSRLDFDIPEAGLDKDEITAKLAAMISADAPVTTRWITDAELEANPGLVKTMSVKPPTGSGRVRLVEIAGLDLQPCGGTHVRRTSEIGAVRVTQIEKKGKQNRRVRIGWA